MTMPGGGGNDRQVNVTLNANVDPYVKSLTAANQATVKLGTALKQIDDLMVKLTKRVGIGAMAVGGAGLVSTFGDVKQAAALQQSFSALAAQATQTGTNVGTITTQVQKLSMQIPVATGSLAAMATQIASLGVTGTQNIVTLTKQAEQLAAATNTAPGQLFTQLIQMNQSLGGSLQNLERYGSALTSIQQNMGVSAQDTLSMANSIQAVGQKAGISEQNLLGIASAFVKVGADGTTGAQAFNQVMNAMTDAVSRNSSQVLTFSNLLGVTSNQFKSLVSNDPTQAFVKFIDAITAQGSKASITLESLGLDSVRLQRVFAALTTGQANLGSALAQSNQAFQQNTATASASAAAWDTLNSKIVTLKNSAGEIRDQLGAPLLGVFQPLTDAVTTLTKGLSGLIHFTNDAPWPIGDTITSLVSKTPALLLLGGAFMTLTASLSKFAGAWRVLTGAVGINAFRGFMDARSGSGPRDVPENLTGVGGRVGSFLYRQSYGMGRGNNMIGVNARQGLGSMIAGYPLMRARQQFNQATDTLRHPFNPEARAMAKTDPLSAYGMFQSAQRTGRNARNGLVLRLRNPNAGSFSNALADHLEQGFGEFDQSPEGIRRRRFTYVENARTQARRQQEEINTTLGRNDLMNLVSSAEAGQYYQKNGTLDGYSPTDFSRTSLGRLRKRGKKQAGWIGDQTADKAGKAFDASLSEEETAKLANPFQKLATKVKEITGELVKSTGSATKSVFSTIEAFFAQAMAKIQQMAAQTKAAVLGVAATAANPTGAAATVPMMGLPAVPKPDPSTVRATAQAQAQANVQAAKATATTLPGIDDLVASSVIGFPGGTRYGGVGPRNGPFSRNRVPGSPAEGIPDGMVQGGSSGAVARFRTIGQAIAGPDSKLRQDILPGVVEGAKAGGSALLSLASSAKTALGMFLSPQFMIGATLLGPAIWGLTQKIFATQSLVQNKADQYGAGTQTALGRQVLTPAQLAQQGNKTLVADTTDMFGTVALGNSKSGTFLDAHSAVLNQLDAVQKTSQSPDAKMAAYRAILQQEAIGDVNQNGGTPMDAAQKQQLAEIALAFTGQNSSFAQQILGGSSLSNINTTGTPSGNNFYGLISSQLAKGSFSGSDKAAMLTALGGRAVTSYETQGGSLAGAIYAAANTQQLTGGNVWNSEKAFRGLRNGQSPTYKGAPQGFGNSQTGDVLKSFIDNYNSQNPNHKVNLGSVDSVQGFYAKLQDQAGKGDEAAASLLRSFKSLNLVFDSSGALTKASLDKLATAASGAANALIDKTSTGANRVADSRMSQAFDKVTYGQDGSLLDMLSTPDNQNYTKDITKTLQEMSGASAQGVFDPKNAEALRGEAEAIGQLKQQVATGTPQWQQLDQLQQGVFAKVGEAATMSGGGFTAQLQAQTSTLQDYVNTGYTSATAADFNAQQDATTQMAEQGVQQLQQYYMQVKDANISMERAAEDHHTQMVRSERDYNRQIAEAQYQFGVQQSESAYQYKLSTTEQVYSFNEQIRQMKYSLANSLGTPGALVQAQYTQGAQSSLAGFKAQTADMQKSLDAMNQLQQMGVSQDAIRVFKLDDPTNFAQAQRYLQDFMSNPQLIKSFNDAVAQNLNISQAIASDPNNSQFADMQRQFNHTATLAAQSFAHSADVAMTAFNHSMTQSKQSYDIQMQDFQTDYNTQTTRSLADLARLGEQSQMTWSQLVDWAKNSGLPWISQLGDAETQAINAIAAATNAVNGSLQTLPQTFSTALSSISTNLQSFLKANPALAAAFEAANGISSGQSGGAGSGSADANSNKQLLAARANLYGWGSGSQLAALNNIVQRESGFNNTAQNPTSTAYGLFQFLDSTWKSYGIAKTSDPGQQINAGLAYIQQRYGTPSAAWSHEQTNGWYAQGAIFDKATTIGVGEAGPEMVLPLNTQGASFMAQTLRASLQMMSPNLATEVRRGRTSAYSAPAASNMSYHHTDASTNFTGEITVVAQDPNEMARKLAAKKRLTQLSRPAGAR